MLERPRGNDDVRNLGKSQTMILERDNAVQRKSLLCQTRQFEVRLWFNADIGKELRTGYHRRLHGHYAIGVDGRVSYLFLLFGFVPTRAGTIREQPSEGNGPNDPKRS